MIGTCHIVVAMKPLCGNFIQNALKYGVSGLNIDGTRISTSETLRAGAGGLLSNVRDAKDYPDDPGFRQNSAGRWPSNVILCHGSGCHVSGAKKIRSPIRRPTGKPIYNTEGKPVGWNDNKVMDTTVRTHADANGMETVDVWECDTDCPVRRTGEQSGESGWNAHVNKLTRIERANDFGTAARYFKQVGEFAEEPSERRIV
jgi:hypothetical protein